MLTGTFQNYAAFVALAVALASLLGCSTHMETLERAVNTRQGKIDVIHTSEYDLVSATRTSTGTAEVLRIYIEGDGKAWATRTQPSTDPSPRNLLMMQLAMEDPRPSVYLARPCQFHKSAGCGVSVWTDKRFAAPVIRSYEEALHKLKERHGARSIELIGYSGGGYIAMVIAGLRTDVTQVQTIAGNLDPAAWAQHHAISLLNGLKDLNQFPRLRLLPQVHFVGAEDKVVPQELVDSIVRKNGFRCATVRRVGASHEAGWTGMTRLLSETAGCG